MHNLHDMKWLVFGKLILFFIILILLPFFSYFFPSFFQKDKYLNLEGVHVHRDGSSHFTLTDKHTDKSTDALLKQQ